MRLIFNLVTERSIALLMRIGYLARGVVFLLIGGFALLAAGGFGVSPQGARDALELLFEKQSGRYVLWVLAAGLACFAAWRFLQCGFDLERHGGNLYGLMRRGMLAGSSLFYIALATATIRITLMHQRVSEDQSAREWTEWVMEQQLGRVLIALIAVGFIGVAIGLVLKAIRAPYRQHLDATQGQRTMAVVLGSYGILARAVLFFLCGIFLAIAAYDSNSQEAVSLAGVLRAMQHQAHGGVLLGVAAIGLLAFGFFEIIEAASHQATAPKLMESSRSGGGDLP